MAQARGSLRLNLRGHLHIVAAANARGQTYLRSQSFSAPIHISKPHSDAGWLVLNIANPTPGFLGGDRVHVFAQAECGSRLLITTPSATRIHSTPNEFAELQQEFRVSANGSLDYFPEYLIPQSQSRFRQSTTIHVEPGGILLWTEMVAPGRTARGEAFHYDELRLHSDVFSGSQHVIRERFHLDPTTTNPLRAVFPTAYYGSIVCLCHGLRTDASCWNSIHAFHDPARIWTGVTTPATGTFVIKMIAVDSPTLRHTIDAARLEIYQALRMTPPSLRRITGSSSVPRSPYPGIAPPAR